MFCIFQISFLGVEVSSSGLMSLVSARRGNKHFGALLILLLLLFKLVSGYATLMVFMARVASSESLFFWICSVERQFHTRVGLNMYRRLHGTTCIQPWKAQLASHKSCNVSTRVWIIDAHSGLGSIFFLLTQLRNVHWSLHLQIYFHVLKKNKTKKQISSFFQFLNSKQIDPNPGAHSDCHTETQTHKHRHTDTKTSTSKSLCSHHSRYWNIWSDFCQLLSNSS